MPEIILISEFEYNKGETVFKKYSGEKYQFVPANNDEEPLSRKIIELNGKAVIVGVDPYKNKLYDAIPKGGIIARFGVGHDNIDKDLAQKKGILVTNTPGALDNAVAEHAICLIGCLARSSHYQNNRLKSGEWDPMTGVEVRGKILAVIGFGNIGQKVCKKASLGLEMDVIGCDVISKEDLCKKSGLSFDEIKEKIGVVS